LAVLGLAGKHEALFGDNLLLLKDNQKILRCLLFLEECPESYIQIVVNYLNGLELNEDLRVRLEEFKPSSTDPSSVESE
jgi:hypothetical protein